MEKFVSKVICKSHVKYQMPSLCPVELQAVWLYRLKSNYNKGEMGPFMPRNECAFPKKLSQISML